MPIAAHKVQHNSKLGRIVQPANPERPPPHHKILLVEENHEARQHFALDSLHRSILDGMGANFSGCA
jgi:hypothetical protein